MMTHNTKLTTSTIMLMIKMIMMFLAEICFNAIIIKKRLKTHDRVMRKETLAFKYTYV